MTQADKQRMLAEMLKGVPADTAAHRLLEEMCIKELDTIEPILNEILERDLTVCIQIMVETLTPEQRAEVAAKLRARAIRLDLNGRRN